MPTPLLPPTPPGVDETSWLAAVSEVRGYCQWHLAPSLTETVTVDGSGGLVQLLPTLHLTGLTSITNDGTAVTDPQWSEMGAVRGALWTSKYRGVVAEITHGYDDFPPEVLAVAKVLAQGMTGGGAPGGSPTRMASGPHSVEFGDQGPLIKAVLDRYRIRARA